MTKRCAYLDKNTHCLKGEQCTYPVCLEPHDHLRYGLIDANWGDRRHIPDHWGRHSRGEV